MAKRLAKPAASVGYRLDWDRDKVQAMDVAAATAGLSVASFSRLALELLVERGKVTLEDVRAEAGRIGVKAAAKKPRGKK
jgi:hypothetical protein